jgi:signal transduction histidine kinase
MRKPVSLFRYVHESLSPYRWATSLLVSVMVSALFAGIALYYRVSSDQQMIHAITPYLATLVESQDRPELLRVFQSISETKDAEIILVQRGIVLASSRDISEMDRPYVYPKSLTTILGAEFTSDRIFNRAVVSRRGGPENSAVVFLFTPLWATMRNAAGVAVMTFLMALGTSIVSAVQMKKAIRAALRPLEQLHQEIRALGQGLTGASTPIGIRELEEIRHTIVGTNIDLENARDRLAEERAKKLSAESYKRLIHDLHNPVAALRQNVRVLTDAGSDDEAKHEAAESVPRIADQILKQVEAEKKNLENQPAALRESDIRSCVEVSVQQVEAALGSHTHKQLAIEVPDGPVIAAHDPDLLQRAIINLLENGIEAADSKVRVALHQSSEGASITVSDDGPGMDESQVSLHLQGRGQSSKADRQAFGLSSANHIVRAHGGRIIYRRGELGGASFEIRLGAV